MVHDLTVPMVELIYKADADRSKRVTVNDAKIAHKVFMQHWDMNKIELVKQMKILLLTNSGRVLGILEVATGTMDRAQFDPKFIFSAALLAGAGRIIIGNNNTSSSLKPSRDDLISTKVLAYTGRMMSIEVTDHVIFSKDGYFSFADNGLLDSLRFEIK